jgi:hypothetical protein
LLDSLGFSWDPRIEQWAEAFAALQRFRIREGHCRVTPDHVEDGLNLGVWVITQRQKRDRLSAEQICKLASLGFSLNPRDEKWEEAFAALQQFRKREGHFKIPRDHVEAGIRLGNWAANQRVNRSALPPERAKRLNLIGFTWKP